MSVIYASAGVLAVTLPVPDEESAYRTVWARYPTAFPALESSAPDGIVDQLRRYAAGERVIFRAALDWSGRTPFQQAVWQATQDIPYGETRSYGWVAQQIGRPRAARAVGQALGANPTPIIVPCHRVIAADGGLGGFGGNLDMKRRLLALERGGA